MTEVRYTQLIENGYVKHTMTFSGHAEYNMDHRDIVCASLSTIANMGAAALFFGCPESSQAHLEPGDSSITAVCQKYSNGEDIVSCIFRAMEHEIEELQAQYPENVHLTTLHEYR